MAGLAAVSAPSIADQNSVCLSRGASVGSALTMLMTIGHSTLTEEDFVGRCHQAGVRTVIDVRSHPTSKWDRFKRENMEGPDSWLSKAHIGYRWEPALGGWSARHSDDQALVDWMANRGVDVGAYGHGYFPKNQIAKPSPQVASDQASWTNQGLYDYAWFTATGEFQQAALALARESEPGYSLPGAALMCAEFVWWKCHRSMIGDFLVACGYDVLHTMPKPASHRKLIGNRLDRYPVEVIESWKRVAGDRWAR